MGSTDVTAPSSNSYTKKIVYTMDDDGNRSSVAVTPYGSGTTTSNYTDNNLNQYTAVGGTSRSHDDNGNLIDDGTLDFEYDYRNQIVRIRQGANTVGEYKYDALGRRVEKDDGTDVRRFIYSDAETVSVFDGSNAWLQDFVFGEVIDEVLMLEQADALDFDSDANTSETTRSFYHRNALGSVMSITDMNEAEVVSYRYDPYGAVTITRNSTTQASDPLGNPWMYTGRLVDEETGLQYYRARHYSPNTGRFLQRDPIGYADTANLYQYASSRPTNARDPSGLSTWSDYELCVEDAKAAFDKKSRVINMQAHRKLGKIKQEVHDVVDVTRGPTDTITGIAAILVAARKWPPEYRKRADAVEQARKDAIELARAEMTKAIDECWRRCYGKWYWWTSPEEIAAFRDGGPSFRDMSDKERGRVVARNSGRNRSRWTDPNPGPWPEEVKKKHEEEAWERELKEQDGGD